MAGSQHRNTQQQHPNPGLFSFIWSHVQMYSQVLKYKYSTTTVRRWKSVGATRGGVYADRCTHVGGLQLSQGCGSGWISVSKLKSLRDPLCRC